MNQLQVSNLKLGIVCPMANESATLVPFVKAVLEQCNAAGFKSVDFFAIVDNITRDNTRELLDYLAEEQPQVHVVWAPENRNVTDAYVKGYQEALNSDCDWILEIDAGYSHQPSDIPQFFEKMKEGYVCVFGSRFCKGGSMLESSLKRRIISGGGSLLTNLLLGTRLKDMTSGFELFSRTVLQEVLDKGIKSRGPFFQTEIKIYCRDLRIVEVPIHYRAPSHNLNSAALKDAFAGLWRLFRLRVSGAGD